MTIAALAPSAGISALPHRVYILLAVLVGMFVLAGVAMLIARVLAARRSDARLAAVAGVGISRADDRPTASEGWWSETLDDEGADAGLDPRRGFGPEADELGVRLSGAPVVAGAPSARTRAGRAAAVPLVAAVEPVSPVAARPPVPVAYSVPAAPAVLAGTVSATGAGASTADAVLGHQGDPEGLTWASSTEGGSDAWWAEIAEEDSPSSPPHPGF